VSLILPPHFKICPAHGGDAVYLHEALDAGPPMVGVGLVTPFLARKWLGAGEPDYRPVVMINQERTVLVGAGEVRQVSSYGDGPVAIEVVKLDDDQADTVHTEVEALRMRYEPAADDEISGLVLDEAGGRVLAGAMALRELSKPQVMVVKVVANHKGEE
jgi:hypothetical protein